MDVHQWRIEQTGAGVLAFISNNGYLDNPTFRGMRQRLMNAFSDIYLLDLHGNSKKKERAPDGSKDENVFDIQQGVTLGVFIKQPDKKTPADVYRADLWGVRESKYETLFETDVKTTRWKKLKPQSPLWLFYPQEETAKAEYERGWKITDALPVNVLGFQSHRDGFAIDLDAASLRARILNLRQKSHSDEELKALYNLSDSGGWKLSAARKRLRDDKEWEKHFVECLYRPFDRRHCYFSTVAMDRPRRELRDHVAGRDNLCLNTVRQTKMSKWGHAVVSDAPAPAVYVEVKDGSNVFPLYLYSKDTTEDGQSALQVQTTHWPTGKDGRRPNLNPDFVADVEKRVGLSFSADGRGNLKGTFGPEDAFNYIYAVLHSPTYRTRYAEFLKSDFPRVPLTSDVKLFRALCGLGEQLVALHLLESPRLDKPIARFPVKGPNLVEKGFPKFFGPGERAPGMSEPLAAGRVYISKGEPQGGKQGQYFEGVPSEVWNFHIGGYQVCEKWLKDRRGRTLTYDDLEHYCKVVTALQETIRLMSAIDAAIPSWPIE